MSLSLAKRLPAASEGFASSASSTTLSSRGVARDGGAALTELVVPKGARPSGSLGSSTGTVGAGWWW